MNRIILHIILTLLFVNIIRLCYAQQDLGCKRNYFKRNIVTFLPFPTLNNKL
jgi:hypothetical protein